MSEMNTRQAFFRLVREALSLCEGHEREARLKCAAGLVAVGRIEVIHPPNLVDEERAAS